MLLGTKTSALKYSTDRTLLTPMLVIDDTFK